MSFFSVCVEPGDEPEERVRGHQGPRQPVVFVGAFASRSRRRPVGSLASEAQHHRGEEAGRLVQVSHLLVLWIECLAMATEFMGSISRHGNVFGFFSSSSFFFLLLHFPHHGSILSVVCPMWFLFEVKHYSGINSQPWIKKLGR